MSGFGQRLSGTSLVGLGFRYRGNRKSTRLFLLQKMTTTKNEYGTVALAKSSSIRPL